jgi:DNA-binding FadR family transcriptional regulator|tara:strand:+ start:29376 stop:30128 length:753 start_codon:yes stop_codon:yes gene_type:complete
MARERVCDFVVRQIEQLILEGALKPGDRLPAERKFAAQLRVSRPSLREGLQILSARGLLVTRRGGATEITESLDPALENPLLELISASPDAQQDVMELRHALESMAAYHAAARRTEIDIEVLRTAYKRMIGSHSEGDAVVEATADADFHLAIGEASHNVVLVHVMRSLFSLLRRSIHYNLENLYQRPDNFKHLRDQHYHLMNAIIDGDPEAAKAASDAHISYVEKTLQDMNIHRTREARAHRRATGLSLS